MAMVDVDDISLQADSHHDSWLGMRVVTHCAEAGMPWVQGKVYVHVNTLHKVRHLKDDL